MNHRDLVKAIACSLLAAAGGLGCSSDAVGERPGGQKDALLNADQYLYLACNATGWNPAEANRLKSTSDPAVFTLEYTVAQQWLVNSPDQCSFILTNQLNGWGTTQTRYSSTRPATPITVPGQDALVVSSSTFGVRYSALGTYRLSVNWDQKTFAIGNRPSAQQRIDACAQDPRVQAGLVSAQVCAGADIFFRETFGGNGRTCGTCHPMANNTTLDVRFIEELRARNPADPLFVAETNSNLANLETSDLGNFAAILENVDGFQNPTQRFVSRTVSHVLSLSTSLTRDPGDETATSPALERLGWGGDGVGDGSLLAFLEGAIKQHFPKDLRRRDNVDFQKPTVEEAELTRTFQLSLGRLNELDLEQVSILDTEAEEGRRAFMDTSRGRCNVCHFNAGANFQDTGLNRNFDNGIRFASNANFLNGNRDAGFGGENDTQENPETGGFGNGTFSPPPLIEAADTAPFFHNAFKFQSRLPDDIEEAVNFYRLPSDAFGQSLGGKFLEQRFGSKLVLDGQDAAFIARFLRVLNAAFNLDLAKQRLDAASALIALSGNGSATIQTGLMELALAELDDALEVLPDRGEIHDNARGPVQAAKDAVVLGIAATAATQRGTHITSALAQIAAGRGHFGSNITFELGQGNLMF